jgi:ketosteroid isomerase-like protein
MMSASHWTITNLLFRYAECVDAADFDGVADLLADATLTAEGSRMHIEGRDAVRAHYVNNLRMHPDGLRTKHVTTNAIAEVDEDAGTATCRSYCMVLQASSPEVALQPIWAGRYHDSFVRVDGEWRFRTRHFITDLVGDMSEHLKVDLSTL